MKLIHFAIVLLAINFFLLSCVDFGFSAPADETLYFQTYTTILGLAAMDKSIQNPAQQAIQDSANRGFISQPLAEDFFFQTVNVTVYHEAVPSNHGTFKMYATLYAHNASGYAYWSSDVSASETQLAPGSRVDSVLICVGLQLLKEDRISVYVGPINNGADTGLDMYWGNSTYPSSISYSGTAYYIPEFPSTLLFFIIIAETSLALVVHKSNAKCDKSKREPQLGQSVSGR